MGLPSFEAGALKLTVACAFQAFAVTFVGAPGGPTGVTALEGDDGRPFPVALAAVAVAESELSWAARSEPVSFSFLVFRLRNPLTSMDLLRILSPT
jgi:hypothetical protein